MFSVAKASESSRWGQLPEPEMRSEGLDFILDFEKVNPLHSLRSRRLEVVGERENGRARETREGCQAPATQANVPQQRQQILYSLGPASALWGKGEK